MWMSPSTWRMEITYDQFMDIKGRVPGFYNITFTLLKRLRMILLCTDRNRFYKRNAKWNQIYFEWLSKTIGHCGHPGNSACSTVCELYVPRHCTGPTGPCHLFIRPSTHLHRIALESDILTFICSQVVPLFVGSKSSSLSTHSCSSRHRSRSRSRWQKSTCTKNQFRWWLLYVTILTPHFHTSVFYVCRLTYMMLVLGVIGHFVLVSWMVLLILLLNLPADFSPEILKSDVGRISKRGLYYPRIIVHGLHWNTTWESEIVGIRAAYGCLVFLTDCWQ